MNFTREDVLRELELLPVWRLRATLQPVAPEAMPAPEQVSVKIETQVIDAPVVETKAAAPVIAESTPYVCTISDDKKWAFIWPASLILSASQSTLFGNILVALKISKSNQTEIESLANIEASIIISMGEAAARQVLNTTESIETLRGKTHQLANAPLIVTYHPNDMLQDLHLKAKTWEDLCLAKRIVLGV
jgi:uracil-DNA glycosylase